LDPFAVEIVCSDQALAERAAERLALAGRGWSVSIKDYPDDACSFLVTDDPQLAGAFPQRAVCLDGSMPASEITACIDEVYFQKTGLSGLAFLRSERPSTFILFTSCGGGQGSSTCAALMARLLSSRKRGSVLCLSFDPVIFDRRPGESAGAEDLLQPEDSLAFEKLLLRLIGSCGAPDPGSLEPLIKSAFKKDAYGAYHAGGFSGMNPLWEADEEMLLTALESIGGSSVFSHVVLDVPCGHRSFELISSLCEYRFLVDREGRSGSWLAKRMKSCASAQKAVFSLFSPEHDEHAAYLDIHGQLGSEVRTLAEESGI